MIRTLTKTTLAAAADSLAAMDKDFARVLVTHGVPPLWARKTGFETLIRIILEQQVSLASAGAMYRRLRESLSPLTPGKIIEAGATSLRSLGITRQKAGYFVNVARAVESGTLKFRTLGRLDDQAAMARLTCIKGVGPWTARVYLLMAMRRPDIWPTGDIALAASLWNLKSLPSRPTSEELAEMAEAWRPHRATAARLLWLHYLKGMRK